LFWLIEKQEIWYPDIDRSDGMKVLYSTLKIALDSGVIVNEEKA